jgi:hypothetical protein
MSERRRAQLGLLSACIVLASTIAIIYQGGTQAPRIGQQSDGAITGEIKRTSMPMVAANK